MLINAMEVTGIEGTYRSTCESTLEVLRRNKDSLMAVLEAFVYDPLLNWRLIDKKPKSKKSKGHGEGISVSSKGPISVTGSTESNIESLVEYKEMVSKKNESIGGSVVEPEALNKKALDIVQRVRDKLTGRDFSKEESLEVGEQVELLISQARSHENLCQ